MNIQAKKLVLIEELLRIDDEGFILRLESLIKDEKKKLRKRELKPMPLDEFREMIDQAKQDSDAGRVISHYLFSNEIQNRGGRSYTIVRQPGLKNPFLLLTFFFSTCSFYPILNLYIQRYQRKEDKK